MKVIEIAKRAGVGAHAVRFYVRAGLVVPRRNPSNNYKQFGEHDVARLRFIRGVQGLGFSLAEIAGFLDRLDAGVCACNEIHAHLSNKIWEVRERMEELAKRHDFMQKVYESWDETMGNDNDIGALCRLLEQHADDWPRVDVKLSALPKPSKPQAAARSRRKASHGPAPDSSAEAERQAIAPGIEQILNWQWTSA